MAVDRTQLAHQRLSALAEQRRLAASEFELSSPSRARLQDEVRRMRRGPGARHESSEVPAGPGWWRGLLPWIAVGVALIPFAAIVFFSVPDESPPLALQPAGPPLASAPAIPSIPIPEMPQFFAGEMAKTDTVTTAATAASPPPEPARRLATAQATSVSKPARVRRRYKSNIGDAPALGILREFDVVQRGARVELRDADGSVYTGPVSRLAARGPAGGGWTFEARGLSRSLRQTVVITGNFAVPPEPGPAARATLAAPASVPAERTVSTAKEAMLDLPLSLSVLVSGTNILERRALPVGP